MSHLKDVSARCLPHLGQKWYKIPYLGIVGPNVGPGWVKNGKKSCFDTIHYTTNPVFPKNKVLNSHSLLNKSKLKDELSKPKDELTNLHKIL